jgi:hypothetical protein
MSAASWIVDKSYMIADNFHKHLFYATANILLSYYVMDVVRQDMDVNEHDELSKFTLWHKLKEQHFYCCSTYHCRVFNNEQTSYAKMNVK